MHEASPPRCTIALTAYRIPESPRTQRHVDGCLASSERQRVGCLEFAAVPRGGALTSPAKLASRLDAQRCDGLNTGWLRLAPTPQFPVRAILSSDACASCWLAFGFTPHTLRRMDSARKRHWSLRLLLEFPSTIASSETGRVSVGEHFAGSTNDTTVLSLLAGVDLHLKEEGYSALSDAAIADSFARQCQRPPMHERWLVGSLTCHA